MSYAPGMFEVEQKLKEIEERLAALEAPKKGDLRFDMETGHLQFFDGTKWIQIGSRLG